MYKILEDTNQSMVIESRSQVAWGLGKSTGKGEQEELQSEVMVINQVLRKLQRNKVSAMMWEGQGIMGAPERVRGGIGQE